MMEPLKSFLTKDSFSEKIEHMVQYDEYTYFEAVVEFAAECDKDPEELMPFMSQVLLDKVRKSAIDAGMITTGDGDLEELMG